LLNGLILGWLFWNIPPAYPKLSEILGVRKSLLEVLTPEEWELVLG
jgi:hypothetical protein